MNRLTRFHIILAHIVIALVIFSFTIYPGCKDPFEHAPPEDSLVPPPQPPVFLNPVDNFVLMTDSQNFRVAMNWEEVEGADIYQIEIEGDSYPKGIINVDTNYYEFGILLFDMLDKYTWQARAHSSNWETYTTWSEKWHFETRLRPPPPQMLYPPNDTIFYVDSLPVLFELKWDIVQDEEFYQLQIFKDDSLIDLLIVFTNNHIVYITELGQYKWQVRASSSNWQHYTFWSDLWHFYVDRRN
jgi:hypothetical protein